MVTSIAWKQAKNATKDLIRPIIRNLPASFLPPLFVTEFTDAECDPSNIASFDRGISMGKFCKAFLVLFLVLAIGGWRPSPKPVNGPHHAGCASSALRFEDHKADRIGHASDC